MYTLINKCVVVESTIIQVNTYVEMKQLDQIYQI